MFKYLREFVVCKVNMKLFLHQIHHSRNKFTIKHQVPWTFANIYYTCWCLFLYLYTFHTTTIIMIVIIGFIFGQKAKQLPRINLPLFSLLRHLLLSKMHISNCINISHKNTSTFHKWIISNVPSVIVRLL